MLSQTAGLQWLLGPDQTLNQAASLGKCTHLGRKNTLLLFHLEHLVHASDREVAGSEHSCVTYAFY